VHATAAVHDGGDHVARVRDIGRGRFNRRYIGRPKTISRVVTFVPTMDDTTLSLSFSLSLSQARAATAALERNSLASTDSCNSIVHRMQTRSPSFCIVPRSSRANKRTVSVHAMLHTPSASRGPTVGSPEPSAHNKPSRWLRLSRYHVFAPEEYRVR
jgi:hypothetical protein